MNENEKKHTKEQEDKATTNEKEKNHSKEHKEDHDKDKKHLNKTKQDQKGLRPPVQRNSSGGKAGGISEAL